MCRLFETIRIEEGKPQNLGWHAARMRRSGLIMDAGCRMQDERCTMYDVRCTMYDVRCTMYDVRCTMYDVRCTMYESRATYHVSGDWLEELIHVPENMKEGIVKCNVVYEKKILEISYQQYLKRPVRSLKLVYADTLDYHVKYLDRTALDALFALRGDCDDIIIVKDGLITDTSISNLIFYDGAQWFTPANPLLEGTCRARLIAEGMVLVRDIKPDELGQYQGCKLINAMREPEEDDVVSIY